MQGPLPVSDEHTGLRERLDPKTHFHDVENIQGKNGRLFPFCIVWSPIPVITWLLPFVGHVGLCDSRGYIWDFAGPYYIGRDDFLFGAPTRYVKLSLSHIREADEHFYDNCVKYTNCYYAQRMHNLCFQNCHSHVAVGLEQMKYRGIGYWNMIMISVWLFFCGRFVSMWGIITSFLPSVFIYGIIAAMYSVAQG